MERISSHATDDLLASSAPTPTGPPAFFSRFARDVTVERISQHVCFAPVPIIFSSPSVFFILPLARAAKQIIILARRSKIGAIPLVGSPQQQRKRVGKREKDRTITLENSASHAMTLICYHHSFPARLLARLLACLLSFFLPSFRPGRRPRVVRKMSPFPVCDSCPSPCRPARSTTLTKMHRRAAAFLGFRPRLRPKRARGIPARPPVRVRTKREIGRRS